MRLEFTQYKLEHMKFILGKRKDRFISRLKEEWDYYEEYVMVLFVSLVVAAAIVYVFIRVASFQWHT